MITKNSQEGYRPSTTNNNSNTQPSSYRPNTSSSPTNTINPANKGNLNDRRR